jgi:hypothetical protein
MIYMSIKQTKVFQIGGFVQELQKQDVKCIVVSRYHTKAGTRGQQMEEA